MKVTVSFPCNIYDKYQAVHALMCSMGISTIEYRLRRETSCICSSDLSPNDRWTVTLEVTEAQLSAFLDKELEVTANIFKPELPKREANNVAPFVVTQPGLILS